jgi:hypothetical protein
MRMSLRVRPLFFSANLASYPSGRNPSSALAAHGARAHVVHYQARLDYRWRPELVRTYVT